MRNKIISEPRELGALSEEEFNALTPEQLLVYGSLNRMSVDISPYNASGIAAQMANDPENNLAAGEFRFDETSGTWVKVG